jgi:transcription elongation factor GreA
MPNGNGTDQIELTQEGLDELQAELQELTDVKLPAVIDRVAKAREYGDLSENSEYHNARDDQQLIETRIEEIQGIVARAKVVKHTRSTQKVGIGSKVTITKTGDKKGKRIIEIVGEFEADPASNKVSNASPMGKALIGKKKGDAAVIKAPAGEIEYTIVEIK